MRPILSNSKKAICLSAILCLFFPFILSSAAGIRYLLALRIAQ